MSEEMVWLAPMPLKRAVKLSEQYEGSEFGLYSQNGLDYGAALHPKDDEQRKTLVREEGLSGQEFDAEGFDAEATAEDIREADTVVKQIYGVA